MGIRLRGWRGGEGGGEICPVCRGEGARATPMWSIGGAGIRRGSRNALGEAVTTVLSNKI